MRIELNDDRCFHCGLPNPSPPVHLMIQGVEREFCCVGCSAVASVIAEAGLENFYLQRTALQEKVESTLDSPSPFIDFSSLCDRNADGDTELHVLLDGVTCSACVWLCEKALLQREGVQDVSVRFDTAACRIVFSPEKTSANQLVDGLRKLGYGVRPHTYSAQEKQFKRQERALLSRMGVSGLAMMNVVVLSVAGHFGKTRDIASDISGLIAYSALFISVLATVYCAWPFFSGFVRSIKQRALTMDVTLSLTIILALLLSAWHVVGGELAQDGKTYFESVLMLIFFILFTRYIELRVRHSNARHALRLDDAEDLNVDCMQSDGRWESKPLAEVQIGDEVRLAAGEKNYIDGIILQGESDVDESAFNGEFIPQRRSVDDRLYAGSVNVGAELVLKATAVGEDTQYAQILHMAERAQFTKPQRVALADRMAAQFLWLVLACTVIAAFAWVWIDSTRVVDVVLATLIAACPCALSIATPTAFSVAMTGLRRLGVLIKQPDVLEQLTDVNRVMFDKTGTLTKVSPRIDRVILCADVAVPHVMAVVMAMQEDSQHVLAAAFQDLSTNSSDTLHVERESRSFDIALSTLQQQLPILSLQDCQHVIGAGVEAAVEGSLYRLGSLQFIREGLLANSEYKSESSLELPEVLAGGQIAIAFADQQRILAWFILEERLRVEAKATVTVLRKRGLNVDVVSGDEVLRVASIGEQLALPCSSLHGKQSAKDKWQKVANWQTQGDTVMAIGDGANDSPALAAADISVVMPVAAIAARAKASIVLLQPDLQKLLLLFACGKRLQAVLRSSFTWSLWYNLFALSLAVSGVLTPLLAAIGMSLSSLLVVMNALRVRRVFGYSSDNLADT